MSIKFVLAALLSVITCGIFAREGGDNPDKALDASLKAARDAAEQRVSDPADKNKNLTQDERKKLQAQKKEDLQEYKAMIKDNLAGIKAQFQMAEQAWNAKNYKQAGTYYLSVSKANVPGAEEMVDTSNQRINSDMEKLARAHIAAGDDAGLQRDFMKQIQELTIVVKDFDITKASKDASSKLANLRSKPEVAGFVEFAQAEALLADAKLTEAMAALNAIVANPRYENSIAALKAARKIDELNKNEETRATLKKEFLAKADKEAPSLLNIAKNYANNNQPKAAKEKLVTVIDKYPDTPYAEEAKKQLETLPSGK